MLHRVQQSLNNAIWQSGQQPSYPSYEEDDYQQKSIHEIKQMFSHPDARSSGSRQHSKYFTASLPRPHSWRKPPTHFPAGMSEPGWAPRSLQEIEASRRHQAPTSSRYNPQHSSMPINRQPPHQRYNIPHEEHEPPAWLGSLRSSGGMRQWDREMADNIMHNDIHHHYPKPAPPSHPVDHNMGSPADAEPFSPKVVGVHYAPDSNPRIYQASNEPDNSGTATVQHLQYNSPIGLYSRENVENTLEAQTRGKAGYGTLRVSGDGSSKPQFNPQQSRVYQMLMEEEETKRHHGVSSQHYRPERSARYEEHAPSEEMRYHGYVDHVVQSPTMTALAAQYGDDEGAGISDF